jgi:hypothetical protein
VHIEEEEDIIVDQGDDPAIQIHVDKKVIRGGEVTWENWNFNTATEITFIVKAKPETPDDDPGNVIYTLTGNEIDRVDGIHGNITVVATKASTAKARVLRYKIVHTENARDVTVGAGKFIVRDT